MSYPAGGGEPPAYPAYPGAAGARQARPPLTKRMRTGHWVAIDCAVALFAAICDTAIVTNTSYVDHARLPLALVFAAAVFFPVALRRRAPVTAFAALVVLGVLLARLSPAAPPTIFLAAAYVLYTVTVQARKRTGAASLALLLAVMIGLAIAGTTTRTVAVGPPGSVRVNDADTGVFVPVGLAGVIAWMTGYSVRQRRRYVVTLQQQAASSAVAEERLRIARELHDVVAHSMSVIAVQAGYGQYVIDASPDGAKDALGAIQATSRDALEEMRRMLGVLRQQDTGTGAGEADTTALTGADPTAAATVQAAVAGQPPGGSSAGGTGRAPLAPAPGLAGLDRLVMRTRGAGVHVTLDVAGQARSAPAGVDLSAYRIIQEALTNVVRHAGTGAACAVSVTYTDLDLVIQVTDDGGLSASYRPAIGGTPGQAPAAGLMSAGPLSAGPLSVGPVSACTGLDGLAAAGAGHGIIGMRERVNLCGGSFHAGPRPEGGFQVMAALPLPAAAYPAASGPQAAQAAAGTAGERGPLAPVHVTPGGVPLADSAATPAGPAADPAGAAGYGGDRG
jgi:signal transduction histidine kinase